MRLRGALVAVLVVASSACSDDRSTAPQSTPAASAEATPPVDDVPFLAPGDWPSTPDFGTWTSIGPVDLERNGQGDPPALGCARMTYPAGTVSRGYASGGLSRAQDVPRGLAAAGDQYVAEVADLAAARSLADRLVAEFIACVDGGDYEELPNHDAGDGVRIFAQYGSYESQDLLRTVLYAIGRTEGFVSVEVLQTDRPRTLVPAKDFAATATRAMELLAAAPSDPS